MKRYRNLEGLTLKITKDQVEYVAHLARLEFGEQEKEKFTTQLNNILLYMEKLTRWTRRASSPRRTPSPSRTPSGRMSSGSRFPRALAGQRPAESGNSYRVPKVIE